jgi:hypothetical protein
MLFEQMDQIQDGEAVQAIEACQALEMHERQRGWVERRTQTVIAGSVDAAVLPYLLRYVDRELNPTDVARATGKTGSAVWKTLRKQAAEMSRALAVA